MKQVGIREFQRNLYKILDEQLPVVITVNVRKKGMKAVILKKCLILPYDEQIEINHDKLESYKPPLKTIVYPPMTSMESPDNLEVEEDSISNEGSSIVEEEEEKKPGLFQRIFKK